MTGRRRVSLALALAPFLVGCGFQPLYGSGPDSPLADLPDIYVDNIQAGHNGQLLREALQQHFESPDSGADSRYRLVVAFGQTAQGIAIQPDNSTTFTRVIVSCVWTLFTVGVAPKQLASGNARTVDGFNQIDQQYFQTTESNDALIDRATANLADQVSLQVAAWFKRARDTNNPVLAAVERSGG